MTPVAGDKAFDWNKEFPQVFGPHPASLSLARRGIVEAHASLSLARRGTEGEVGFDVVIGNPPYGTYNALSNQTKHYLIKRNIYGKTSDTAEFFIRLVIIYLLNKKGIFSFLIPKGITYVKNWNGLRKLILKNYNLDIVIDTSQSFNEVLYEMIIINLSLEKIGKPIFRFSGSVLFESGFNR